MFKIGQEVFAINKRGQKKRTKILNKLSSKKYIVDCTDVVQDEKNLCTTVEKNTKLLNCTRLEVEKAFSRHIFHRDYFAHYFRWMHALRFVNKNTKVLDFGSGQANQALVFWANRHIPLLYKGFEYVKTVVDATTIRLQQLKWVSIEQKDLTIPIVEDCEIYNLIISFEVLEHIGVDNVNTYLQNMKKFADENTVILLSTPVYDHDVGAAQNHIVAGEVNEYTQTELENILRSNGFKIINKFGTFASIKDYKNHLLPWQKEMFEELKKYYESSIVSIMMAPMLPQYSRNAIYELRK